MSWIIWAATAVAMCITNPASAAKFTSVATQEGKVIIVLNGEIIEGDSESLEAQIKLANGANRVVSGIRLNSPGGLLWEGAKLADVIRRAKMAAIVPSGSQCASACFVVFAAGVQKFASHTASIGVHRASNQSERESGNATIAMAGFAKELGVPSSIIGKMVATPPEQMLWLTPVELISMGTTMTGKPVQVPPELPAAVIQYNRLHPDVTVGDVRNLSPVPLQSTDPSYRQQRDRLKEGWRKAGMPD